MNFLSCVDLKEKDIVSIVGAGGKTSLLFQLAQEMKHINAKVLCTTTTKIYVPEKENYDFISIGDNVNSVHRIERAGIYVYGSKVNLENKMTGLVEEQLDAIINHFDYSLIEADGAKGLGIKGWNDTEPVIYKFSTKTIGILDIQTLGMRITEKNVHRMNEFIAITGSCVGEVISLEHLFKVITHPQGLFKNAIGKKILFINKVDDNNYENIANQLVDRIHMSAANILNKIIIGTMKEKFAKCVSPICIQKE